MLIPDSLTGLLALVAYETIYFTSLSSFRQRWYELFLGLHVVLQIVALALLFFHHHGSRPYVVAALIIFLIDRLVFRMALKSYTTDASLEIKEDGLTVAVQASIPLQSGSGLMRCLSRPGISGGWDSTDHVFLSVPYLGRKHWIQAHPFTIASRAPSPGQSAVNLDLIIRAQDGFSQDLLQYAQNHAHTEVRLDGPYGSHSAVRMLRDSDLAVVIAGGSGIAVGWPLVWSVLDPRRQKDMEISIEEAGLPKKILLVWVVRQKSHISWIRQEEIQHLRQSGVEVIIPPPTEAYGHPDISGYVTDWIVACDAGLNRLPQKVGIVCSGPDSMNRTVRNLASTLMFEGRMTSIEVEKFGW